MSEKDMKIYHVETQEDYDDLMIELEEQGYRWANHDKPTSKPHYWIDMEDETVVYLHKSGKFLITRGNLKTAISNNRMKEIIKHKAKGVNQMEKVVVPQFVADWYENNKFGYTLYGLLGFLNGDYHSNVKLQEWVRNCHAKESNGMTHAQEVIAKMHLYGYEVVEKKYYWRKKKEYLCVFEEQEELYLNVNKETGKLSLESKTEIGIIQTSLTETEVRRIVSKEDFNKLEKVEITE